MYLQQASGKSTVQHLRYIGREGVDRQGEQGRAYGTITDEADTAAFEERGRGDRLRRQGLPDGRDVAGWVFDQQYLYGTIAICTGVLGISGRLGCLQIGHIGGCGQGCR